MKRNICKTILIITAISMLCACTLPAKEYVGSASDSKTGTSESSKKDPDKNNDASVKDPDIAGPSVTDTDVDSLKYEALDAYAELLKDYMNNPCIYEPSEDEWGEADVPEDVAFKLIYLDDDDIPELVISNGTAPWNPVHVVSFKGNSPVEVGAYSLYGEMYYKPKTGYIMPMYYMPAMEAEITKLGSNKSKTISGEEAALSFIAVYGYEDKTFLSDVSDIGKTLKEMMSSAPVGLTKNGIPVFDDSYLKEGDLLLEGLNAEQIPGIWYYDGDDYCDTAWIEFDNVGTFTEHSYDGVVLESGTLVYREPSPLLKDGGIYDMLDFAGNKLLSFEIAPDDEYGYTMNFSGEIYHKY